MLIVSSRFKLIFDLVYFQINDNVKNSMSIIEYRMFVLWWSIQRYHSFQTKIYCSPKEVSCWTNKLFVRWTPDTLLTCSIWHWIYEKNYEQTLNFVIEAIFSIPSECNSSEEIHYVINDGIKGIIPNTPHTFLSIVYTFCGCINVIFFFWCFVISLLAANDIRIIFFNLCLITLLWSIQRCEYLFFFFLLVLMYMFSHRSIFGSHKLLVVRDFRAVSSGGTHRICTQTQTETTKK